MTTRHGLVTSMRSEESRDVPTHAPRDPVSAELELELNADVLRLFREELTERQRASLRHDERTDSMRAARRRPLEPSFQAAVQAPKPFICRTLHRYRFAALAARR